ncbi:hypothetical protein ACFWXB_11100 [Tsukamurella tyrosinosolvens]|uniref:hypothetical protein n=1 Tax=Tsukamurella tyrosinosolvens TaxID=57704 RepID=UPI000C7EBE51|nr:hypothetical protein [Tsukamurella tyrosinosolvens]AUN41104.1 hypothetical protein ASU32_14715 [Tsukamurella tyrosinosolvens]MEC4615106.1 hypothetical protein [Tsukamurella tyrosinosolvens]QRY83865.1 hypothetical protein JVY00_18800 [Tsukamurella tyrosinosolvens]RDB49299.1 hypothetical protein DVB87_03635 [Tsukamurella tyrosinosolvens]
MADPTPDPSEEFLTSAARLFETARPWIAAALAEHSAHPDGEPGACRLCALGGAVARHIEPFAAEASKSLGHFADEVLADLLRLAEELLGSARIAAAAVAADYLATVGHEPPETAGAADPVAPDHAEPAAPSSQAGGYERIDIRLSAPGEDQPQ